MKKLYTVAMLSLLAIIVQAQNINEQETRPAGENLWQDTSYYNKYRPALDSILEMQRLRWNSDFDYLVREVGDTVRPYTQTEWVRDSMSLESRNWDNPNEPWPGTISKFPIYQPDKNYKADSANRNRAGRTQDRKFPRNETYDGDQPMPVPSGAGDRHSLARDSAGWHTGQDFLYMKKNQLMVSRSGIRSRVLQSIKLNDGAVVLADGTVKLPDGNTLQLKKGERINLFEKGLRIIPAGE